MACIVWRAAGPPCSFGQPRVSQPLPASFRWKSRKNSQRSSPPSPRPMPPPPPLVAQSAGSSLRRNARTSCRKASSSDVKRNSMALPPDSGRERRQVYYGHGSFDMAIRPLLALLLAPLLAACASPPRKLSSLRLDPKRIRTLIATGDVIPARWVDKQIRDRGNDFAYPLVATADILRAADLTVINLEAPLIEGCPRQEPGTFTFCGLPGFATALQAAGVDVATLENNHIGNWGPDGIAETVQHLEAE